ncbi:CotH kinase family protein [uncultured Sunxiuqinia sp.]|uniref:CotH kinase family protein n=1 Tax=uncultured Sunxiuqinia sp. TaxID=1573825 RepID=UPI002AA84848|nr:CotH kinase family protein [uncultured Sunxiuqinia sp.]
MTQIERFFLLLFFIIFWGCKKEDYVPPVDYPDIELNSDYWGIDTINKIIVYNGNSTTINNGELVIGNIVLDVETNDKTISEGKAYRAYYSEEVFNLFYTELPIVTIGTNDVEIIDEPKIGGSLKILERDKETYNSLIGVELRGSASQTYPKKSYSMELWKDDMGDSEEKASLLGMRVDDDWILDGMWNEPNRIRDFTSHELWLEIGRVQNANKKTKLGINRKYCELFENGRYKGVYYLGEKIDRKQLDLEKYTDQIEGELYKGYTWAGGVTYTGLVDYANTSKEWNGYEAKYPDDIGSLDWSNLFNHVDFVLNSSQSEFNAEITSRIDMENAIDYYIFLNLIFAADNTGKNMYTCKFDKSSLYFFVAWDMDGSFGNDWKGERIDRTNLLLSNGLYDKLLNFPSFRDELKERWSELRINALTTERLIKRFIDNSDYLERNAIYKREALIPEITQNYSDTEIDYIQSWIERRVLFLDGYFSGL